MLFQSDVVISTNNTTILTRHEHVINDLKRTVAREKVSVDNSGSVKHEGNSSHINSLTLQKGVQWPVFEIF